MVIAAIGAISATDIAIGAGVGAAVGGIGAAVTGGNVLQGIGFGALGGGLTGGLGSALGGLGSAAGDVASTAGDLSGAIGSGAGTIFDASTSSLGGAFGTDLGTTALGDTFANAATNDFLGSSIDSGFGNFFSPSTLSSLGADSSGSALGGSSGGIGSALRGLLPSGSSFLSPSLLSGASNALSGYFASANQEAAANNATAAQLNMFGQMQTNLLPFIQTGQGAVGALSKSTGLDTNNPLGSPLLQAPTSNWTIDQLARTPGYQFNLSQGLQSVQNSAAARGLGSSGAALKGAAGYATGLADSTYQNQFNNAVTNQTNQFNKLMALSQLGQNSAANLGASGVQTGANIGNNTIGAANAGSAAIMNAGNNASNFLLAQPFSNLANAQANQLAQQSAGGQ